MFNPSPAMPWFSPYGYGDPRSELGRPGDTPMAPAPQAGTNQASTAADVARWEEYIKTLTEAWAASSGLQRRQLEAQITDAKKARENALRIAQLQDSGADRRQIAQLQQQQKQFEASHALEQQKLGLSYASTYAQYASTPDRYFMATDFADAATRAGQGLTPTSYGNSGLAAPTAKRPSDFAVLAGYGQNGSTGQTGSDANGQASATANATTKDGRVTALQGLIKALPPSNDLGMNQQDYAVLEAARKLYESPGDIAAGTLQSWRPGQRQMLASAGARLGYNVPDWEAEYNRQQPGQRSGFAA